MKISTLVCSAVCALCFASISYGAPVAEGNPFTIEKGLASDFVSLPAEENLLYQRPTTVNGNTAVAREGCSSSPDVLTDGLIPAGYPMNTRYTMGDNTSLEWEFPLISSLSEVRIYSLWGDNNRNDIVVKSIEVKNPNGTWSELPNSAFGYSQQSAYNTIGALAPEKKRYVRYYDDSEGYLSVLCMGLRINFGHQDNSYGGFMEIQAKGHAAWKSLGEMAKVASSDVSFAQVGDTGVYAFGSFGAMLALEDLYVERVVKDGVGTVISRVPYGKLSANESMQIDVEEGTVVEMVCTPWSDSIVVGAKVSGVTGANVSVVTNGVYAIYTFRDVAAASSMTFAEAGYVDVLVVAGGGGGGYTMGGGGGAGGVLFQKDVYVPAGTLEVLVGEGGEAATGEGVPGVNGGDSWFGTLMHSYGGGGGGSWSNQKGLAGGSGGGSAQSGTIHAACVTGQGNVGGAPYGNRVGGGGGAGAPGEDGHADEEVAGSGGDGIVCDITGERVVYGGGGGGGCGHLNWVSQYGAFAPGKGGAGGGGEGAAFNAPLARGGNGVDGLGGGGGGGSYGNGGGTATRGGNGGSGVVIVRTLLVDLTDATPDVAARYADVVGPTSVEFGWRVLSLGASDASGELVLCYGTSPDRLDQERVLDAEVESTGEGSVVLDEFSPGATYYAQFVFRSQASSTPEVVSGRCTFTLPSEHLATPYAGLWQVRFDTGATDWNTDVMGIPEGTMDTRRQRSLGATMAYSRDPHANDFDPTITHSWREYCTWAYVGYVYLEAGFYTFVSSMDDTVYVNIDGEPVHRVDGYQANATSTWQCPTTGWHTVDVRAGNNTVGAGPMGGYALEDGLRFKRDSESEWRIFMDSGDGSFLCISTSPVLTLEACSRTDDSARLTLTIASGLEGASLEVCFGSEYAADETGWVAIPVGTIAAGESSRIDTVTVPAGARFVRYRVQKDGAYYRTATRSLADIPVVDVANPMVGFSGLASAEPCAVELQASVLAVGEGASACDLTLAYGTTPEKLVRTATFANCAEGLNVLRLEGLLPGHIYYGTLQASNALGGESDTTAIFSFRTADFASLEYESLVGLWQARVDGSQTLWNTDILSLPLGKTIYDRNRTLGAQMVYSAGNRVNDFNPALTERWDGNVTWIYVGAIHLPAGEIRFRSSFDDSIYIRIGDTAVHSPNAYTGGASSSWTCPKAGWYPLLIGAGNGGGGAGPMGGVAANECVLFSTDNGMTWRQFIDSGDGSFLRTKIPYRAIDVDAYAFENNGFTASLSFSDDGEDVDALRIAYGTTYGGDDPEAWEHTTFVAEIASTDDAYTFTGLADVDDLQYVRFYFGSGEHIRWSVPLYRVDASIPALASPLVIDGHRGDTLVVSGCLLSAGDGDVAAGVTIEVATTPDMANPVVWPVGELEPGEAFEVTLHADDPASPNYLVPGETYYVRAVAETDTDADITPIVEVTLPGAPEYGATSATSTLWEAEFAIVVTGPGAGEGTTVTLLTGDSATGLTNTASVVVTEPGLVRFPVDFPFLNQAVSYAFQLEAECATAAWCIVTPIGSLTLTDTANYTWKPEVLEGDWNDATCWIPSIDDPRCAFPNSASTTASFALCTEPTTVHLVGAYTVNTLAGAANLDLTLEGEGVEVSRLTTANLTSAAGMSFTMKNLYHYNSNGFDAYTIPENGALRVLDGAHFQCYSKINFHYNNNTLFEIRGGSLVEYSNGTFYMDGENAHLILDDSELRIKAFGLHFAYTAKAKNNLIEFFGANPIMTGRSFKIGDGTDKVTFGEDPVFLFHAPRGGYEEAPIRNITTNLGIFINDNIQSGRFVLAKDSEMLADGKMATPLARWDDGMYTNRIDTSEQELPSSTTFYYTWTNGAPEPPTEGALPTKLWVLYEQNPTLILFR